MSRAHAQPAAPRSGRAWRLRARGTFVAVAVLGSAGAVGVPGAGPAGSRAVTASAEAGKVGAVMQASFSPNRAGARSVLTYTLGFTGAGGALPPPIRTAAVLIPAGLTGTVDWPSTLGCSKAHLLAHGARGCPARSQIGSGSALLAWAEGAKTVQEKARLWVFMGPNDGEYQLEMLGEGLRPIHRRVVITEPLAVLSGKYSGDVEAQAPAIPTRPGLPDASLLSLNVKVGSLRQSGMGLFVPRACPAGGYPWATELTYATGASETITTTSPCP
ncbi:MAG: hypothetical protein KGJ43_01435 [Acidobacteriota bacterium]|nr:hypothetical protein [Acidobacteriota bacterium]